MDTKKLWSEYAHAIDECEHWAYQVSYGISSDYDYYQWMYWKDRADELGKKLHDLGE